MNPKHKRVLSRVVEKYVLNPQMRFALHRNLAPANFALPGDDRSPKQEDAADAGRRRPRRQRLLARRRAWAAVRLREEPGGGLSSPDQGRSAVARRPRNGASR